MGLPRFSERSGTPLRFRAARWGLCLIVSSDDYHRIRRQYIIVEVVTARRLSGAIICPLGSAIGVALTGAPFKSARYGSPGSWSRSR